MPENGEGAEVVFGKNLEHWTGGPYAVKADASTVFNCKAQFSVEYLFLLFHGQYVLEPAVHTDLSHMKVLFR